MNTPASPPHDPYKVPYEPPPWNTKQEPVFILFNDDEKRNYYEGIPVPGTKEQRAQVLYEPNRGLEQRAQELEEQRLTATAAKGETRNIQEPVTNTEKKSAAETNKTAIPTTSTSAPNKAPNNEPEIKPRRIIKLKLKVPSTGKQPTPVSTAAAPEGMDGLSSERQDNVLEDEDVDMDKGY